MLARRKSVETMLCDINFSSSCTLLQVGSDKTDFMRACTMCSHCVHAVEGPRTLGALKAALFGVGRLV